MTVTKFSHHFRYSFICGCFIYLGLPLIQPLHFLRILIILIYTIVGAFEIFKSRDQNFKVVLLKCLVSATLEILMLLMLYDEEKIPKVSRFYIFRTLFNDILDFWSHDLPGIFQMSRL